MKKRLLIVEDDPELHELYAAMLDTLGCEIVPAYSADEAKQRLEEALPDLIVLDILLGEIMGDTIFRQARQDPRTTGLPVIIVSVLSAERCKSLLELDDRTFFLRKPFRRGQLLEAVQWGLARRGVDGEEAG